jgi:hypothetical protein
MRVWCFVLAIVAIAASQRPTFAQNKEAREALKAAAMQAEVMKKIMAKFDLDGDGNVDEEEKAKAVDQFTKDIDAGDIPDGFNTVLDRNKNGKLEPAEAAAFQAIINRLRAGGGGQPQFGAGGAGGQGLPGFGGPGLGGPGLGGPGAGGGDAFGQVPPEILKKYDRNKNGQLDDHEKKAAMSARGPKKSRKQQLQEKLDLNGDGKITKDEREQVAAQRKAELEEKKAEAEEKRAKAKKKAADKDEDDDRDEKDRDDKAEKDSK